MHDWKKLLITSHYLNDRTQKLDSRNYTYFANSVLFFQVNLKTQSTFFFGQVVKKVIKVVKKNLDPRYNINTLLYVFQPYTAYSLSEAQVLPLGMGISE